MATLKERLSGAFAVEDISDSVINFHKDFTDTYGTYYFSLTDQIADALEEIPAHNQFFTDHGRNHSYRIIDTIARIEEKEDWEFNSAEKYLLANTAWLHDIGMSINVCIVKIPEKSEPIPDWFNEIGTTKGPIQNIHDP